MFKGQRINELIIANNLTQQEAANGIGLSKSTLIKNMNADSTTVRTLEKIADFFRVPIDFFFEREVEVIYPKKWIHHSVNIHGDLKGNNNNVGNISLETHDKIVKSLNDMIAEKERFIQFLIKSNCGVGGSESRSESGNNK